MDNLKVTEGNVTEVTTPDRDNANLGTERGAGMLRRSLEKHGAGRSILIDKKGRIIAGNKTVEQAVGLGLEELIIVQTDGTKLVAVQRMDLDLEADPEARELAYADNRVGQVSLDFDVEQLAADIEAGIDLSGLWADFELDELTSGIIDVEVGLTRQDVPDVLFPSDNGWDVPSLDPALQATAVDLPVSLWGASGRKKRMKGTWLFYCDDYRYEALWKDPSPVVNTHCTNAVEPNFTIGPQTPRAVALWHIYRKRWLARWWQSQGIRIFVDLNIDLEVFGDIALLGVPQGWKAYATRGYSDRRDFTMMEYEAACQRAGTDSILFLLYGGGKDCQQLAQEQGWVYISEHMDVKRGGVVGG